MDQATEKLSVEKTKQSEAVFLTLLLFPGILVKQLQLLYV
jgi:hypothetical protein